MDTLFEGEEKPKSLKRHDRITFKNYEQQVDYLLPHSTEDYLPKNHIARLISLLVDRMDLTHIKSKYRGGGASAYNPSMMLKVWILGFVKKVYTSRKLERALHENLAFIWISGNQKPDFKTLSNFRILLVDDIKTCFKHFVEMGIQLGIISGKDVFVDHTKYQANANPYKMIWKKSLDKRLQKIDEELEVLFQYIQKLNDEEDSENVNSKLDNLDEKLFTKENIDKMISQINTSLKEKTVSKEEAKESKEKLKRTKELIDRKEKVLEKQENTGGKSGYSKTDPDAFAMQVKRSEEIKPCYNEGIATENNFVVSYDVSQNAADTVSFKNIIEQAKENLNKKPENTTADAGYGSKENYDYLESEGIKNFVKFSGSFKEKKFNGMFKLHDFNYDKEKNSFTCLNNVELKFKETITTKNKNRYDETKSIYSAPKEACASCPIKPWCTNFESKNLHVNWELERHKNIARENLNSEEGIKKRKQRAYDVETVFADRKWNQGSRRYILRSLPKVTLEAGLHNISHNIRKMYLYIMEKIDPFQKPYIII